MALLNLRNQRNDNVYYFPRSHTKLAIRIKMHLAEVASQQKGEIVIRLAIVYTLACLMSFFFPAGYWHRAPFVPRSKRGKLRYRWECFLSLISEIKQPKRYLVEDYALAVVRPKSAPL